MGTDISNGVFEVLSPWAEADPIPVKGISPRLPDLARKKLGLLCNTKRAARPILSAVEPKLKARFPTLEISWYLAHNSTGPEEVETANKAQFEDWLKGVDAVVAAVGD